jgi:hypothetical protein
MTKRKGEGPYHNNPDKEKVREMEVERTRAKSCDDGVSLSPTSLTAIQTRNPTLGSPLPSSAGGGNLCRCMTHIE